MGQTQSPNCPHWSSQGAAGGSCALGLYGGHRISHGTCLRCITRCENNPAHAQAVRTRGHLIEPPQEGPGTRLSRILARFGIHATEGCACRRHIAEMNAHGPQWCAANIETIVGWLRTEAKRRHLPFAASLARRLIKRAIS